MQAAAEAAKPIGLIVDGEMRGDANDLVALATVLGLGYLEPAEAQILTLSLTGSGLDGAAFVDAAARYYSMDWLRDFPQEFRRYRGLPVGLTEEPVEPSRALKEPLEAEDAEGGPRYPHEVHELTDTADPAALIRNGLTTREDDSVAVVLNGPATNLARVLGLNGGRELIAAKVKLLAAALGDLPSGGRDEHITADVDAARTLFAEWPTPIVTIGTSTGDALKLDGATITAGLDWTETNPIVDAYRAGGSERMASTREAAAALYAVRPKSGYYEESEPGRISIDSDGAMSFKADAEGAHRYLTLNPADTEGLGQAYAGLARGRPAAREMPEFLSKFIEREKQKALEEKASEAK